MLLRYAGRACAATALGMVLIACSEQDSQSSSQDAAQSSGGDAGGASTSSKVSYGMGYALGGAVRAQSPGELDADRLVAGLRDALAGRERQISEQAFQTALKTVREQAQARTAEQAARNMKKAERFLEENKQREGVKVTDSGLQYKQLASAEGEGKTPDPQDRVVVHYTGELPDGTVFDSSRERGEPAEFRLDRVIPGWTEAVQMMEVGDRYKIWLPPDLAYGERGAGERVPPNSALVFDVKLLEVKEGDAAAGANEAATGQQAAQGRGSGQNGPAAQQRSDAGSSDGGGASSSQ